MSDKDQMFKKIQYRNGTYIGQLANSISSLMLVSQINVDFDNQNTQSDIQPIKQGFGMFLADNQSDVVLGNWKQNQLSGNYVYLGRFLKAFGNMRCDLLEGFNMIAIIGGSSHERFSYMHNLYQILYTTAVQGATMHQKNIEYLMNRDVTIYANFRKGIPHGNIIVILQNFIIVYATTDNNQKQLIQECLLNAENAQATLNQYFPNASHTQLPKFLKSMMEPYSLLYNKVLNGKNINKNGSSFNLPSNNNVNKYKISQVQRSQYQPVIRFYEENNIFFGFVQKHTAIQYGFILRDYEFISLGLHSAGLLNGIGTLFYYKTTNMNTNQKIKDSDNIAIYRLPKISSSSTAKDKVVNFQGKGSIFDGVFVNGHCEGVGVCYNPKTNQYIFGNFINHSEVEIIQTGTGWPTQIIRQYHMQFHLRSLKLCSQFVDMNNYRNQLFQALFKNTVVNSFHNKSSKKQSKQQKLKLQFSSPVYTPKKRFTESNAQMNYKYQSDNRQPTTSGDRKILKSRQKAQKFYQSQVNQPNQIAYSNEHKIGTSNYFKIQKDSMRSQLQSNYQPSNGNNQSRYYEHSNQNLKEEPNKEMRRRNWTNVGQSHNNNENSYDNKSKNSKKNTPELTNWKKKNQKTVKWSETNHNKQKPPNDRSLGKQQNQYWSLQRNSLYKQQYNIQRILTDKSPVRRYTQTSSRNNNGYPSYH